MNFSSSALSQHWIKDSPPFPLLYLKILYTHENLRFTESCLKDRKTEISFVHLLTMRKGKWTDESHLLHPKTFHLFDVENG